MSVWCMPLTTSPHHIHTTHIFSLPYVGVMWSLFLIDHLNIILNGTNIIKMIKHKKLIMDMRYDEIGQRAPNHRHYSKKFDCQNTIGGPTS